MIEIFQSETFKRGLSELVDRMAKVRIQTRIDRMSEGNLGDVEPVGGGISEARIHYGPGYRLSHATWCGKIVMLCGGDKSSQARDIEQAKAIAQDWKD